MSSAPSTPAGCGDGTPAQPADAADSVDALTCVDAASPAPTARIAAAGAGRPQIDGGPSAHPTWERMDSDTRVTAPAEGPRVDPSTAFVENCARHLWEATRPAAEPAWGDLSDAVRVIRISVMRRLLDEPS